MTYKRFQLNLIQLNSVDSTNNFAANLIKKTKVVNGTTIMTKRQKFGKGQRGNTWQSEDDKNLIISTVIYPDIKAKDGFYLNIVSSLALSKTLEDLGIESLVKWPNDIIVRGEKIAGILVNNQISNYKINSSIIGLGLNVNQENFENLLKATSIFNQIGQELLIEDVFEQYFAYLDFYTDQLMSFNYGLLMSRYKSKLLGLNQEREFIINGEIRKGIIKNLDESGRLLVQSKEGLKAFAMQEIKFNSLDV